MSFCLPVDGLAMLSCTARNRQSTIERSCGQKACQGKGTGAPSCCERALRLPASDEVGGEIKWEAVILRENSWTTDHAGSRVGHVGPGSRETGHGCTSLCHTHVAGPVCPLEVARAAGAQQFQPLRPRNSLQGP